LVRLDSAGSASPTCPSFAAIAQREKIGSVVLAGGIRRRPQLARHPPHSGARCLHLPHRWGWFASGGDDKILRLVIAVLENEGVRVLGAQQVAPDLLGRPVRWAAETLCSRPAGH
jgi:DUF1009 family protein